MFDNLANFLVEFEILFLWWNMDKFYAQIAIIGLPNAGKSSLFNRLSKARIAITSEVSGTTRDVKKGIVTINDREFLLLDTGGLDDGKLEEDSLFKKVSEKSLQAGEDSDLILYLVDGKSGVNEIDKKIFYSLQKKNPNILLVVNKIDNDKEKDEAWSFMEFGAKECFFISVSHNRGINALKEAILESIQNNPIANLLENNDNESLEEFLDSKFNDEVINIGIIGRVNVGKSSLLNALLQKDRAVVSNVAGTTIDPVDEEGEINGTRVNFVDTAGIRRRGRIDGLEKYALNRTREVLSRTDIAILVLDASEPFVELDEKIAGLIDEYKLGVIVVFNKWDIVHKDFSSIMEDFRLRFKFLDYAPIITISAKNKRHIQKLENEILKVYENFTQRIPTSKINDLIKEATFKHALPSDRGKIVKIYYAVQFESKPPQIALISNRPDSIHFSYKRYLVNFFRERFSLSGVKIIFIARRRGEMASFKQSED